MNAKTRKTATPAQREAAKEKRKKMRTLAKLVADLTPEQRDEIVQRTGAILTIEGRALSTFNSIFVSYQTSGQVSVVGGFKQWKRAGRVVRKGEHGLTIWFPLKKSRKDSDGEEIETDEVRGMALGTVFDISQTDELPATV